MNQIPTCFSGVFDVWNAYKYFVEQRTANIRRDGDNHIDAWRDKLFTNFITYVLPGCLIALIPGVYMSFAHGFVAVGVSDILAVLLIAFGSLNKFLSLATKKVIVIAVLYLLSGVLLIYLSVLGPGRLYLLTLSVVVGITCRSRWAYSTVAINVLISAVCAIIIHYRLMDTLLVKDYSVAVWITVATNLIFLSFVIVMLLRKTIRVLEKTIIAEQGLRRELYLKNQLLTESEEHYKSLFYKSPSPMWILDRETLRFLQVNESAIKIYGYTNEEFLSMKLTDIKIETEMESVQQYLKENDHTGNPVAIVTQHIKKNKEQFYVEVIFNSIPFKSKEASLAISNDITKQMNYVKSIQKQNEKLKEIAWIQSHKVRSPLTNIMGLVGLYKDGIPDTTVNEIMEGILVSANALDEVIKETVIKSNPSD